MCSPCVDRKLVVSTWTSLVPQDSGTLQGCCSAPFEVVQDGPSTCWQKNTYQFPTHSLQSSGNTAQSMFVSFLSSSLAAWLCQHLCAGCLVEDKLLMGFKDQNCICRNICSCSIWTYESLGFWIPIWHDDGINWFLGTRSDPSHLHLWGYGLKWEGNAEWWIWDILQIEYLVVWRGMWEIFVKSRLRLQRLWRQDLCNYLAALTVSSA